MKKKLKKYKVSADDSMGLAFSVVDRPAVESEFTFLSEQKIENFVAAEGERRMIYGCALRPDFSIYRNNGGEEYYLEFDADAIDKISKNYFKMGFQDAWTEAHKDEVEGLTITESWIKESMTMDKSIALGLDPSLPIGSWFIGCYCENDDIWQKVKEGTYHGFSIEAVVGLEEFNSQITNENNDEIMTNEMFLDKIKQMFNDFVASVSLNKQEDQIEPIEPEALAEQTPNEPTVETPAEPTQEPQEAVVEPQPTVEPQAPKEEPTEPKNEPQEVAPKEDTKHLEELINSMKSEIEALKGLNAELKGKVKTLEKQPSAKPISTVGSKGAQSGVESSTYQSWREQMRKMY